MGTLALRGVDEKSSPPSAPVVAAPTWNSTTKKPEGVTGGQNVSSCEEMRRHCSSCGGAHKAIHRFCPFCGNSVVSTL